MHVFIPGMLTSYAEKYQAQIIPINQTFKSNHRHLITKTHLTGGSQKASLVQLHVYSTRYSVRSSTQMSPLHNITNRHPSPNNITLIPTATTFTCFHIYTRNSIQVNGCLWDIHSIMKLSFKWTTALKPKLCLGSTAHCLSESMLLWSAYYISICITYIHIISKLHIHGMNVIYIHIYNVHKLCMLYIYIYFIFIIYVTLPLETLHNSFTTMLLSRACSIPTT